MSKLIKIPSLSGALKEIRQLHGEIMDGGRTTIEKAMRIGELLAGLKSGLKHGQWLDWVGENLPFKERAARNYMRCYANRKIIKSALNADFGPADAYKLLAFSNPTHVSQNSGENEWYTPTQFIEAAREVMGSIDCDPASAELANETVRATKFYTKDDDGLNQQWNGNVWMNPPYSSDLIGQFAEAVSAKFESGEIKQAIVLVNNATETEWFSRVVKNSTAVCFPQSRIKYLDKTGQPAHTPLQGQAILYLGNQTKRFIQTFSEFGFVLCRP